MPMLMRARFPNTPPYTNIRGNHKVQHFETLVVNDQLAKLCSFASISTSRLLLTNAEVQMRIIIDLLFVGGIHLVWEMV